MKKYLDLGSGRRALEGYDSTDFNINANTTYVFDLEKSPYPIKSNYYDKVYCRMVVEHLHNPSVVMREANRILKEGGEFTVITTHFSSCHALIGDIHVSTFSYLYWYCWARYFEDMMVKINYPDWEYKTKNVKFARVNHKIVFGKSPFWNKKVEKLVNKSFSRQRIYESTFLCRLFPAEETITVYRK